MSYKLAKSSKKAQINTPTSKTILIDLKLVIVCQKSWKFMRPWKIRCCSWQIFETLCVYGSLRLWGKCFMVEFWVDPCLTQTWNLFDTRPEFVFSCSSHPCTSHQTSNNHYNVTLYQTLTANMTTMPHLRHTSISPLQQVSHRQLNHIIYMIYTMSCK